jgi:hypothetical protein
MFLLLLKIQILPKKPKISKKAKISQNLPKKPKYAKKNQKFEKIRKTASTAAFATSTAYLASLVQKQVIGEHKGNIRET